MLGRRSGIAQYSLYSVTQATPAFFFERELLLASGGDAIETRLPILLGRPPFRAQPTVLRHPVERRIEGALFDAQQVRGHALDVRSDGVAVHPSLRGDCLEDEKDERTLQDIVLVLRHDTYLARLPGYVKNRG